MPADTVGRQSEQSQRFQRLRAALELSVSDILTEVGAEHEVKFTGRTSATLTELVVDKVKRTAEDLEAFANHAKRTTITSDDVKLLTRRNSELNARLTSLSRDIQPPPGRRENKTKKKSKKNEEEAENSGVGRSKGGPLNKQPHEVVLID